MSSTPVIAPSTFQPEEFVKMVWEALEMSQITDMLKVLPSGNIMSKNIDSTASPQPAMSPSPSAPVQS